jgi:hypothetical protein
VSKNQLDALPGDFERFAFVNCAVGLCVGPFELTLAFASQE